MDVITDKQRKELFELMRSIKRNIDNKELAPALINASDLHSNLIALKEESIEIAKEQYAAWEKLNEQQKTLARHLNKPDYNQEYERLLNELNLDQKEYLLQLILEDMKEDERIYRTFLKFYRMAVEAVKYE